jgi:hypothetical protein
MQAEGENLAPRRMSERNFTRGATGELSESPRHCLCMSTLTGHHGGHCTWRCSQVKDDSIPHSSTSNPVSAARMSAAVVLPAPACENNSPESTKFAADEYLHPHIQRFKRLTRRSAQHQNALCWLGTFTFSCFKPVPYVLLLLRADAHLHSHVRTSANYIYCCTGDTHVLG